MAMKNHKRLSVTRLITPVALAVALTACSSGPSTPQSVDITLDPNQAVQTYLMRADSSTGSLQNDWLIMALKASIDANDASQAELLIKRLSRQQLSDMQQAEWQLARADLLLTQEQYDEAHAQLNFRPEWQIADAQWKEYHQLRSSLFLKQSDYFNAARELSLESEFSAQAEQQLLADSVWNNLALSKSQVKLQAGRESNLIFAGWLQLASYSNTLAASLPQLQSELEQWLKANPAHPAAVYTPKAITEILQLEVSKPLHTALLLPLTGKFAKQSKLIRDGFLLEMMNDKERDKDATLTVVDTNTTSIEEFEAQLVEKNIDFVVGPLIKENIEKLQRADDNFSKSVPMLALNIPEDIEANTNTCYLALSPEQEVAQAAKHLFEEGYQFPLVLAPQGRLGDRVVAAFKSEWTKYSDNKVDVNRFGNKRQLQRNINQVFGLQESQQHIAQMEALLSVPLETQPRSRRDIDAVYILANSSELTLIKPFIEVAINPDTTPPKLFSNSRSNSGQEQYEDLTGVSYGDIPLLIHPDGKIKAQMDQLWPNNSNAKKRLQAMGMDAYRLIDQLPQMKVVPGYTIEGNIGVLSIDDKCVVQREISWAEYGSAQ